MGTLGPSLDEGRLIVKWVAIRRHWLISSVPSLSIIRTPGLSLDEGRLIVKWVAIRRHWLISSVPSLSIIRTPGLSQVVAKLTMSRGIFKRINEIRRLLLLLLTKEIFTMIRDTTKKL